MVGLAADHAALVVAIVTEGAIDARVARLVAATEHADEALLAVRVEQAAAAERGEDRLVGRVATTGREQADGREQQRGGATSGELA